MSSHREAPSISKDPNADNTDVYAFVNPYGETAGGRPSHVTLIANFIPFQLPYGGPNFSEFADDVVYSIHVSNSGDAVADVIFNFQFNTVVTNPDTFLYNTGPIGKKGTRYENWTRQQYYSVTRVVRNGSKLNSKVLAKGLAVPPNNVGARSTPDYDANFTEDAVHKIGGYTSVFAGQRADAFTVDLGSIFDLGGIRPLNQAHELKLDNMPGVNGLSGLNVHTIAIQLPIVAVSRDGVLPTNKTAKSSVIGVWATASRSRSRVFDAKTGTYKPMGGYVQVSRLGNPLVNEVINPMGEKDYWNASPPNGDSKFAKYVAQPELAHLLPALYPGAFPNLDDFNKSGKDRTDLEAILLTGIPYGVLKDGNGDAVHFTTETGGPVAEMLRLNLAIPPTMPGDDGYSNMGVLGGDLGGFPNGRRVGDDVTAIELQAIAGKTIPLVYPNYQVDDAAMNLKDGSENDYYSNPKVPNGASVNAIFPFMPAPNSGYATTPLLGSTGGQSGTDGAPDQAGSGDGQAAAAGNSAQNKRKNGAASSGAASSGAASKSKQKNLGKSNAKSNKKDGEKSLH